MNGTVVSIRSVSVTIAVAVAVAAAVVLTGTAPSRAAGHEHCFTDPDGDTRTPQGQPVSAPRADILEVCASYEPTVLEFSMRVAEPVDPNTDQAWLDGDAIAIWGMQDQALAYGAPSGQVFMGVTNGALRVVATWFDDATPVCEGSASFDGTWYRASFDPRCLDVPATISFNGYAEYDGAEDVAPEGMGREGEGRFDGPLTRDGEPVPAERLAGRFSGPTRIDTAVAISRSEFPHGAEEAYLARADDFPDALAAGSLTRGPILLVPQCGPLPQVVGHEIERLAPDRVFALGGTVAICDALLQEARDR